MKIERIVFKEFVGNRTNLVREVSRHIISFIVSGQLKFGYKFPSVNKLHESMKISKTTISKVFQELSAGKYIVLSNGRVAVVCYLDPVYKNPANFGKVVNAQGLVNPDFGFTYEKNKLFHSRKTQFLKNNPLLDKNAIYQPLIEKCCSVLNGVQGTDYDSSDIYYLHGTRLLYTSICSVLNTKGSVFLVPENYFFVKGILNSLKIKFITLKVDEEGICVNEIESLCQRFKVRAVCFHSQSGFPFPVDTAPERIIAIQALQDKYKFKLLESGGYLPRLLVKPNPVLEAFKDNLADVIYLWKLTKMQEDVRNLIFVAASEDVIKQVGKTASNLGCPLNLPVAFATHEVISHKSFVASYQGNNAAMEVLSETIRSIFLHDNFWDPSTIGLENGSEFYLRPNKGHFTPAVFKRLKELKINFIDPALYIGDKQVVDGIWIDLSFYLGQKHLTPNIVYFEKWLRTMVKMG